MICQVCKQTSIEETSDYELVCMNCGAAYHLELLGYYKEGTDDRIECGPEFDEWMDKHRKS